MAIYLLTELTPPLCQMPMCTEVATRRVTYDDGYASGPGWDFCVEHSGTFRERCLCSESMLPGTGPHRPWCPLSERAPKHTMTPQQMDRYYGSTAIHRRRKRSS